MGLVVVLTGIAMLFPGEVVDLISWVEEWFDEES